MSAGYRTGLRIERGMRAREARTNRAGLHPPRRRYTYAGSGRMAIAQDIQEQRMVLYNLGWDTYERLLRDHANASAPRFTYDRGMLEIMSPLPEHERLNRAVELLIAVIAEETGVEVYSLGSTTFMREDLQRGFEPDSSFYTRNLNRIQGKERIDLHVDPPPDLVVEIEITHPSIDKLSIFVQLAVPEVWRLDGKHAEILLLQDDRYVAGARSHAFPPVHAGALATLMSASLDVGNVEWMRRVRAWLHAGTQEPDGGTPA
jgi:Uma2 family endonuclease